MVASEAIRCVRLRRNLSQRQLSDRAGLAPSAAQKAETGTAISLRTFAKLAVALGLNRTEVYTVICAEAAEEVAA